MRQPNTRCDSPAKRTQWTQPKVVKLDAGAAEGDPGPVRPDALNLS